MCQSLSYIFPLSLCEDLENLEMLEIMLCGVEQIVAMEEGSMEHSFSFPQLNKLILSHLANLTSFYRGKHSLDCPSLKELNVYGCAFNHLDLFSIEKVNFILTCFCLSIFLSFSNLFNFSVESQLGEIGNKWNRVVGDIESRKYLSKSSNS
jgi:hypothetical protein